MKPIQHWKCEACKGYNDVLNVLCSFCKTDKPEWISSKYQLSVEFERQVFDYCGIFAASHSYREGRVMTPNEELHAKFFSEEAVIVSTMSDADLDEHIHELEAIAREAKARVLAGQQEQRTRAAKSGNKAWKVEPIGPDPNVTDSLNKVKQRSGRMSKLDGMRARMAALGIPDSELDQMMAKMVAAARKDPKALKEENKLKGNMKEHQPPSIVTEEERLARIAKRKELDEQDKAIEKAEKEANTAPVHNKKDEKPILVLEPEEKAVVQANPFEPNNSEEAKRKAILDLFTNPKKV